MPGDYPLSDEMKSRYRASVALTDKEFKSHTKNERWAIISMLIGFCEAARSYSWNEGNEARAADKKALGKSTTAANSARRLSSILKQYPRQFGFAVSAASLGCEVFLRKEDDTVPIGYVPAVQGIDALRLAELLDGMEEKLRDKFILAKAGPMMHRTRHGPLHFTKPIEDQSKLPDPETCLAVYLVAKLRNYDLTGNWRMGAGSPIPRDGRTRWDLVEQWVQDALADSSRSIKPAEAKAAKLLDRHPDLEIWDYS